MDPSIQQMRKKTRNPAKMVRNGGPWAVPPNLVASDSSVMESPPEGLEFEANTPNNLSLLSNFTVLFNLQVK